MNNKKVTIKLDAGAHRAAKIAAAEAGMTLEAWIARAIANQCESDWQEEQIAAARQQEE